MSGWPYLKHGSTLLDDGVGSIGCLNCLCCLGLLGLVLIYDTFDQLVLPE